MPGPAATDGWMRMPESRALGVPGRRARRSDLMRATLILAVAIVLAAPGPPVAAQGAWRPLFNGKELDGWYDCKGTAPFTVEDGAIVGRTVVKSPNSFLCTKEAFGDFILEYEVWVATNLNSGVQIRSIGDPAVKNGRVHGLQIEVDPSDRAWSGGIYDEARRGWLHTLLDQPAAQKAFRLSQWNRFRVEAIGTSIRTWLNGVPCADIVDDLTPRGLIALQVHAIGNDETKAGEVIKFRNIRILTQNLEANRTRDKGDTPQYNYIPNTVSPREARDGWKLLWDGKTTA